MTDQELQELAAKAAGLKAKWIGPFMQLDDGEYWYPLEDDGDTFRLAARLGIDVTWNSANRSIGVEELRVARRAIVRAAAEIGRRV